MTTAKGHQAWVPSTPCFTAVFFCRMPSNLILAQCQAYSVPVSLWSLQWLYLLCHAAGSCAGCMKLLTGSHPSLTCQTRHHQHAVFFTATVLSQWLLLNYVSSSLMYEISTDLKITPESSAHLEMNGATDSPNPSTPNAKWEVLQQLDTGIQFFIVALFFHIWSSPKQTIHWDDKDLNSVAMFVLRQTGVNEFK